MANRFPDLRLFLRLHWILIAAAAAGAGVLFLALRWIEPPPPASLVLAAGEAGGGYEYFARRYAEELAKSGVEVRILETRGSLENMRLLQKEGGGVDAAFAQGGTGWMAGVYAYSPDEARIRSLAQIYEEPLWIFTRKKEPFAGLRDLKGKRLAVGLAGSGAHALSVDLLKWSGVNAGNATFLELPEEDAARALRDRRADAAFFVGGPGSTFLKRCAADPGLLLHSFGDAAAFVRRFGYLDAATLPAGVLDLAGPVPEAETVLLSPDAALLARDGLHPALVYLLLEAAKKIHGGHGLLSNAGDFPSARRLEFPLHPEAARYFESGPPFLHKYLPYHVAVFMDRTKILLLPLLTLLIPLFKIAYPTYQWSIRRNIWKWYKQVGAIEADHHAGRSGNRALLERLRALERQAAGVRVPSAYSAELYTLRHHLLMVRDMLERSEAQDRPAPPN
jgi:TRAP transporter TAXI family solute receptor